VRDYNSIDPEGILEHLTGRVFELEVTIITPRCTPTVPESEIASTISNCSNCMPTSNFASIAAVDSRSVREESVLHSEINGCGAVLIDQVPKICRGLA
jgi:hypothetical protein